MVRRWPVSSQPCRVSQGDLPGRQLDTFAVQSCAENIPLLSLLKSPLCPAPSSTRQRDVRVVTDVGCGMRWHQETNDAEPHTVKPCGSDAPTLALNRSTMFPHRASDDASHRTDDGDNTARSPGRARSKPLKPLRREGRMNPLSPVVINSCAFYLHARLRVRRAPGLPCALT
jgi:hypothetical protein